MAEVQFERVGNPATSVAMPPSWIKSGESGPSRKAFGPAFGTPFDGSLLAFLTKTVERPGS